jgi:hypothetical protein
MSLDPAWIALIATVCGGVGLKVVEHWLGRNKVKIDDATQIRDELRLEIAALRDENRLLEAEIVKWREEYYALRERQFQLQTALTLALSKMTDRAQAAEIQARIEPLPLTPGGGT